jgi:hypothetical protein
MSDAKTGQWTRRRLLSALPAMLTPALLPANIRGLIATAKPAPFSRFVDVAANAGLTQTVYYGDSTRNTYIIEVNGTGCAFLDYDNDAWMDVFILGGRRLEAVPPRFQQSSLPQ